MLTTRAVPDRLLVTVALLAVAAPAMAAPPDDLVGEQLRPIGDLGTAIVQALFGGKQEFRKVTVVADEDRRIVLEIKYKHCPNLELKAETLGDDGRVQPQVTCEPVQLVEADGTAQLTLALADDVPPDTVLESAQLRLSASKPGRRGSKLTMTYALPKRWTSNFVSSIRPAAIGAAADLPAVRPLQLTQVMLPPVKMQALPMQIAAPKAAQVLPMQIAPRQRSGRAARGNTVVFQQAHVARPELPSSTLKFTPVASFEFGVPEAVVDRDGRGPGTTQIPWMPSTYSSDIGIAADESLSPLWPVAYQDQNPESGIYYFLPRAYRLQWTPDEGHRMRILYGASGTEGQAGAVNMWAGLVTGVDSNEIAFAAKLCKAYCDDHNLPWSDFLPLPLKGDPRLSLADALQATYEIPASATSIVAMSDVLAGIEAAWQTDTVTKENLQLALTNDVGISGTVVLDPAGDGLSARSIPLRIALADPETFGRIEWDPEGWHNNLPYPVRLDHLCAMLLTGGGTARMPVIYWWDLSGRVVPPDGSVRFDRSEVPSWVDGEAERMWLRYTIPGGPERAEYDAAVLDRITGGVTSLGAYQVTFKTLTPLADMGAVEIALRVRSKYFDPEATAVEQVPAVALSEDGAEYSVGPIHLIDRQPGDHIEGDPLFEYALSVVMPDGRQHVGETWVQEDRLRVPIGTYQVEQSLGFVPGGDHEAP